MSFRAAASILATALLTAAAACGGGTSNYHVPVDSPLMPFQAPDKDELLGNQGGSLDDLTQPIDEPAGGGGESMHEGKMGTEDSSRDEGAVAPAAAKPAPAAKPATPAKPAAPKTPPATKPK